MERKLTILLIDDDKKACGELEAYVETLEDVRLAGITGDANKGLELVCALLPDVIILDLELHQGGGNGLLFLQDLNKLALTHRPYILITTNNTSEVTLESARRLGADFILTKYGTGYSARYVIESVRVMKQAIFAHSAMTPETKESASPGQKDSLLIQRIQRELNLIGVSPKVIGYEYLTEAIFLSVQRKEGNLSHALAIKFNKTAASIERAMQNAINRAWRTSDPGDLLTFYTARIRSDKGVPTLMEFISYYAGKLRIEMDTLPLKEDQ